MTDIDINQNKLNAESISKIPSDLFKGDDTEPFFGENYLSMGYIHGDDKLFVMQGFDEYVLIDFDLDPVMLSCNVSCKLFDWVSHEWKFLKPFEYRIADNNLTTFVAGICKYNYYDKDNVYIVSNTGHTEVFNIIKNIWY